MADVILAGEADDALKAIDAALSGAGEKVEMAGA